MLDLVPRGDRPLHDLRALKGPFRVGDRVDVAIRNQNKERPYCYLDLVPFPVELASVEGGRLRGTVCMPPPRTFDPEGTVEWGMELEFDESFVHGAWPNHGEIKPG